MPRAHLISRPALNVLPALWRAGVQGVNVQTVYGDLNQMIHAEHRGLPHFSHFAARAPDGTGSVSLLSAGSLSATGGTTPAGQRLSPQTGQFAGRAHVAPVKPNAERTYAVRVPAHAAAS